MTRRVLRRLTLIVVLVVLTGSLAAGCSGDEPEQGERTREESLGSERLVVGYDQEPEILNPLIVGGESVATSDLVAAVLEKPYEVQPDLSLAPELAAGPPLVLSKDPLIVEYRLKDYLTFSDGEPLTSADAEFTYRAIMSPANSIITREGWEKIESFETPDEYTVRMTFSEPYAAWRDLIGGPQSVILPRHIYAGEDFNRVLNSELVGSGPYTLKEWNRDEDLVLEANPNYWGEDPEIGQITVRFIPNATELTAALRSGEVGFIKPPLEPGLKQELEGYEGVRVRSAAGTFWEHLAFNTNKVDNLKLRRAVAYGLDRERLLDRLLPGQVRPLNSVLVPEQERFYVPAWEQYSHDPERARALVQDARREGADTTISFTTTGDALRGELQREIKRQLEDVGITVEIENANSSTLFGERLPEGRFQMGEWAWLATPEPQLTGLFSADSFPPDGQNYYRYEDPEASFLMSRADETIDVSERARLLKRVQQIMAEDLPLIPLYQRPVYYAHDEDLEGPKVNPTLAGPFWNVGEWSVRE